MASNVSISSEKRNKILDFFTTFYHTYEYSRTDLAKSQEQFVPANSTDKLYRLSEIYSNPSCAVLGFPVISQRFLPDAAKFGVATDPSSHAIEGTLTRS